MAWRSRSRIGTGWVRFLAVAAAVASLDQPVAAAELNWRVENPFRLFSDPAVTALHRTALDQLTPRERESPVLAIERRLALAAPRGWAESWIDSSCWSDTDKRYGCADNADYAHPTGHRVWVNLSNGPDGLCNWTVTAINKTRTGGETRSVQACQKTLTLDVPYPGGVRVELAQNGRMLAQTVIRVRDLLIVGLGDSFASGDGNPDVPVRFDDRRSLTYRGPGNVRLSGYPARIGSWASLQDSPFGRNGPRWMSRGCHRSLYGHHLRAALQLSLEDPHRSVTFASFACWGAEIINGLFLPIRDNALVPDLPRQSQLSAVATVQCRRGRVIPKEWPRAFEMSGNLPELVDLSGQFCPPAEARRIDLLLVSAGGNDVGFAQLVANAVLKDGTPVRQLSGWVGQLSTPAQARTALALLPHRYKALNRAAHSILHVPWSEADRIVLTSYPPIALDDETGDACEGGRQGMTVTPAFALDQKRTRDNERIGNELYETMRGVSAVYGWTFVDAHRATFVRHGLCAGRPDRLANPADDVRLPRFSDGQWHPFAPSQWEPYTPRRRWVRTPNDGYLTVNFHVPKLTDDVVNLMLASSYSGAFHPTAEGQAAMADAVVVKARRVLDRYGSAGRP